jgi:hypothetical protein
MLDTDLLEMVIIPKAASSGIEAEHLTFIQI